MLGSASLRIGLIVIVMIVACTSSGSDAGEGLPTTGADEMTSEAEMWCTDHIHEVHAGVMDDSPILAMIEDRDMASPVPDDVWAAMDSKPSEVAADLWRDSDSAMWESACLEAFQALGSIEDGVWVWCRQNAEDVGHAAWTLGIVDDFPTIVQESLEEDRYVMERLAYLQAAVHLQFHDLSDYRRVCEAAYDAR